MKRILFVCHGNICRSPMAEFILDKLSGLDAVTARKMFGGYVHIKKA